MSNEYSFLDLAEQVLELEGRPLSPDDIWKAASERGLAAKVGSNGRTPWATLGSRLYKDTQDNPRSPFRRVGERPVLFALKAWGEGAQTSKDAPADPHGEKAEGRRRSSGWAESDLHQLLATYVRTAEHFRCVTKTIDEKRSTKGGYTNADKWTHPDMVGVYFPYRDYDKRTIKLIDTLRQNPYTVFSFELKKELRPSELREKYFQAVSNSSWANEGYLVAAEISDDSAFRDDLQRLVNAFGIGVIQLDPWNIGRSRILYPARHKETLDWATVNRLAEMNADFQQFVDDVVDDAQNKRVRGSYAKPIKPESYQEYLREHHFVG